MSKNKKAKKDEELMSIAQVAEMHDVTRTGILVACQEGRIPRAQKVGHTWVIPKSAARAFKARVYTKSDD